MINLNGLINYFNIKITFIQDYLLLLFGFSQFNNDFHLTSVSLLRHTLVTRILQK